MPSRATDGGNGSSKWTPQLATRGTKKDYRRKVKYNPLARLFFWSVRIANDLLINNVMILAGWIHSFG